MRVSVLAAPLVLAGCIDTCSEAKIYDAVKASVSAELRAPGSAVFPPLDRVSMTRSGSACSFSAQGHVDAHNGFGALVRMEYSALALRATSGEYRATVTSITER